MDFAFTGPGRSPSRGLKKTLWSGAFTARPVPVDARGEEPDKKPQKCRPRAGNTITLSAGYDNRDHPPPLSVKSPGPPTPPPYSYDSPLPAGRPATSPGACRIFSCSSGCLDREASFPESLQGHERGQGGGGVHPGRLTREGDQQPRPDGSQTARPNFRSHQRQARSTRAGRGSLSVKMYSAAQPA